MADDPKDKPDISSPSRPQMIIAPLEETDTQPINQALLQPARGITSPQANNAPWALQQFFNGEIDLDRELATRFPNVPLMSTIRFRSLGAKTRRGVATLATQDGVASVLVEADAATQIVQFSFSFGSMLTLRFRLDDLSSMDRSRWLELMRRDQGGLAFLWGQSRWENDYVICAARKHFTNLYAFSKREFESAVRLTPDVAKQLLDWLDSLWKPGEPPQEPPKLTTW